MPKTILLEDYHLTVIAPAGLRKAEYTAMVRTLRANVFKHVCTKRCAKSFDATRPSRKPDSASTADPY
jgi:hypothetical protein